MREQAQATGFRLAATSDRLRNPADDRTRPVFDRAVRGRTDQFILKFVEPTR